MQQAQLQSIARRNQNGIFDSKETYVQDLKRKASSLDRLSADHLERVLGQRSLSMAALPRHRKTVVRKEPARPMKPLVVAGRHQEYKEACPGEFVWKNTKI